MEMVSLGYIDEARQLERIILSEANARLYGYSKIKARLMAKGYSSDDINRVTKKLVSLGEIDFKENAKKLLQKHFPDGATTEEKKKLLYKNGYKV